MINLLGALDINPLLELYHSLLSKMAIANPTSDMPDMQPISTDKVLKLILEYNGCAFSDDATFIKQQIGEETSAPMNYSIIYIYGAKGNEVNEYYDYIEFYGHKFLVIFMDYFKEYHKPRASQDEDPLEFAMGKSVYYDAIKKIVEVFLATTVCMAEINSPALAATSTAFNYRYDPTIIAALVLRSTIGFFPEDVSDIDYDELSDILANTTPELLCIGIRRHSKTENI